MLSISQKKYCEAPILNMVSTTIEKDKMFVRLDCSHEERWGRKY
jgi:hypothetical protein